MQLFIKTLTGKTVTLGCNPSDTVYSVKQRLQEQYGMPIEQQRLLLADKQLVDTQLLSDYNVQTNGSLEVMLRLLGGVTPPVIQSCNVTQTSLNVRLSSYGGTPSAQVDNFKVDVIDSTTPARSGSYNIPGWPAALGSGTTLLWTAFSATPNVGDSFTVTVTNVSQTTGPSTASSALYMPGPPTYTIGTVTSTTISITITSFGSSASALGAQGDNFTITITDSTTPAKNGTYTFSNWPVTAGNPTTFNWSSFSNTPNGGDSFTVTVTDNTTAAGAGAVSSTQTMPSGGGGGPCFTAASQILTPSGYKSAADIKSGHLVTTADGRHVPVHAITFSVKGTEETAPYCVSKDAIRPGCPYADLHLSPHHTFQIAEDLWLTPAAAAKRYKGVKQYGIGGNITYYHFEAPNFFKDNLICDGTPVESLSNMQITPSMPALYTWSEKRGGYTRWNPYQAVKRMSVAKF
jgi:Ubiquitin family/Hint domain